MSFDIIIGFIIGFMVGAIIVSFISFLKIRKIRESFKEVKIIEHALYHMD